MQTPPPPRSPRGPPAISRLPKVGTKGSQRQIFSMAALYHIISPIHELDLTLAPTPKKPPPLPQDNNLLRALVPLRCALVSHPEVWVLLLTVAAHVVPHL